jgi:hypothetical protein
MSKKFLSILALMIALSPVAVRIARANVCDPEIEKQCSNVQPGNGALASCIQSQWDQFSYDCREQLKAMDSTLRSLQQACSYDAYAYCRDIRPGYGRVKKCLRDNLDKLSNSCRNALK